MATFYWISSIGAPWENGANWSYTDGGAAAGAYPGTNDIANFTGTRTGDVWLTTDLYVDYINMVSGYTGSVALGYNTTVFNDCILAGAAVNLYAAIIAVGGDFDYSNVTTLVPGTSNVILNGTGKYITASGTSSSFYDLDIQGSYTNRGGYLHWGHDLTVRASGSLTIKSSGLGGVWWVMRNTTGSTDAGIYLESGAELIMDDNATAPTSLTWITPGTGGIKAMASTARITKGAIWIYGTNGTDGEGTWVWGATYGIESPINIVGLGTPASTFEFPNTVCKCGALRLAIDASDTGADLTVSPGGNSTDVIISGDMTLATQSTNTGEVAVDNTGATGNLWRINGDFVLDIDDTSGATYSWTRSSELIQFIGTGDSGVDLTGLTVGTLQFWKSGTATTTLISDIIAEGFHVQGSGTTLDSDGLDIEVLGDFFIDAGALWVIGYGTTITLTGSTQADIQVLTKVDPIVLNRSGVGDMCVQVGNVFTTGLTLTDGGWNCDTFNLTLDNAFSKGADAVDLGTGDITVFGGINITGMDATGCRVVIGATQTLTYSASQDLASLKVNAGFNCTLSGTILNLTNEIDLVAGSTLTVGGSSVYSKGACDIYVRAGATWSGTGVDSCRLLEQTAGHGILLNDGEFNIPQLRIFDCATGTRWAPGVYNVTTQVLLYGSAVGVDTGITPDAGIFYINTGDIALNHPAATGDININMSNSPTFHIEGDCLYQDLLTDDRVNWTVGNEILEFDGSLIQDYEWSHTVGNIVINKTAASTAGNLNLTASAHLDCKSLTGTDGGIATNDLPVSVSGDCILDFDQITGGTETWTLSGNFDYKDVTTITGNTTYLMDGVDKLVIGLYTKGIYNFTVDAGATIKISYSWTEPGLANDSVRILNHVLIAGTLHVSYVSGDSGGGSAYLRVRPGANLEVLSGGVIDGNRVIIDGDGGGSGLIWTTGYTWNVDVVQFWNSEATSLIPPGVYGGGLEILAASTTTPSVWEPETGTYALDALSLTGLTGRQPLTLDNRVNIPIFDILGDFLIVPDSAITVQNNHATQPINWSIGGDMTTDHDANFTWVKGTGVLTFDGAAAQTLDMYDELIEKVYVNKTGGTLTLAYHCQPDHFELAAGSFSAATWDVTTEDLTVAGAGDMYYGDLTAPNTNTWYISGSEISTSHTGLRDTARGTDFVYSGVSKNLYTSSGVFRHGIWIQAGASYAQGGERLLATISQIAGSPGELVIEGTLSSVVAESIWCYNGDVRLKSTGVFTADSIVMYQTDSGCGILEWDGDYDPSGGDLVIRGMVSGGLIVPADYSTHDITFNLVAHNDDSTVNLSAGTYIFYNWEAIAVGSAHTLTIDTTTNPTINVKGAITFEETPGIITYTKGSGTITCNDTGDFAVSTRGKELENFVVAKNSSITLGSDLNVTSLSITTGDFDANDFNVTVSGDTTLSTTGTVTMGAGSTWTLSGNFDYSGQSGPLVAETSHVIMDGASKTIEGSGTNLYPLHDVTIDGTLTTVGSGSQYQNGDLNVDGTLTLTGQNWIMRSPAVAVMLGGVYINSGGTLTGSAGLYIDRASTGGGLLSVVGDLTVNLLHFRYPTATGILVAHDYSPITNFRIGHASGEGAVFTWQSGDYTFGALDIYNGDASLTLTMDATTNLSSVTVATDLIFQVLSGGDINIDNNHTTEDIDWHIKGNVTPTITSTGVVNWTKGTGILDFNGTGAQSIDLEVVGTLDAMEVNKTAGTLTYTRGWVAESFVANDGILDFNGQTVSTVGDFTINPAMGTDVQMIADADAMDGVDITVGNAFYVSNVIFKATAAWYLDVQGTSALAHVVDVEYSDARAGITIQTSASKDTTPGTTYNWNFGGDLLYSLSTHCFAWNRMTKRSSR